MFQNINWLFFDVGSTIVDESNPYSHRFHDIARFANVSYTFVSEQAEAFFKEGKKGDKEVARLLGVSVPQWYSEDETLYPDTYNCLETLHRKYKIGIIANQLPGTRQRLLHHNILQFIDIVIASSEEGVSKPDVKIFEIALDKSQCRPENAVMIGDRIDNDIIPAKQIGMNTVWIRQGYGKYWTISQPEETPGLMVNSLSELCNIL